MIIIELLFPFFLPSTHHRFGLLFLSRGFRALSGELRTLPLLSGAPEAQYNIVCPPIFLAARSGLFLFKPALFRLKSDLNLQLNITPRVPLRNIPKLSSGRSDPRVPTLPKLRPPRLWFLPSACLCNFASLEDALFPILAHRSPS